jgi:excisionase family DNA binding protein
MVMRSVVHSSGAAGDAPALAYRVGPFCRSIGIGRTKFYELMARGKIRTVIIGGRRLIPAAEAHRLVREGCE